MKKLNIYFAVLLITALTTNAQVFKKEVYVESTYRPEVADVDKISNMPAINDTVPFITKTDYTVLPSHLKTEYQLKPIKPASMVGTSLDKLYNSYIKLGLGNYVTPLAEFSIHNLRSKEYSVGAYYFHKSSHTKLPLDNGRKVPAGYDHNELAGHGKYFFEGATLSGTVGFNADKYRYYGINLFDTTIYPDNMPDVDMQDIKQTFFHVYAGANIQTSEADSEAFFYSLGLNGGFFKDHFSNKEPYVNLNVSLSQLVKSFRLGIDAGLSNYNLTDSSETYRNNLVKIRPFIKKRGGEWNFTIAGKLYFESGEKTQPYFFPDANISFDIVPKALSMYLGVDGDVELNNYQKTSSENPYVLPGLYIRNTVHQWIAFGGIEGKLSSKASYKLDVRMQAMKDMYFFLNDTLPGYGNHFHVVYDDADLIQYHGEISWAPLSNLSFFTKLNYYTYKMTREDKPWHKPAADFCLSTRYNFKEKIYAEFELLALGKRYAKNNYVDRSETNELDPIFDLNLKLEYKYSNVLTAFLHFYNLSSQEYYLWNQYPSQRINILLGITYKL
jgi:hypothetical protein